MDKTVLKNFAIESRIDLMRKIDKKIKLFYVDEELKKENRGEIIVLSNDKHSFTLTKEEDSNRDKLIKRIVELGYEQVVEEAAYTWFNRIIAIRYMELHDFLPLTIDNKSLNIRVLSSQDGNSNPDILKFSNASRSDLDIEFNKEVYSNLGNDEMKFKYILLLICKKLGKVIPQVFGGITDYIDLLIPDNMLNENGFVYKLVNNINVSNFEEVEIIGWLYQYYNQTEKDKAMNSKNKYKKNEIPYVTQIFTPDWIVKYMVENSLLNYWINHGGSREILKEFPYYIDTQSETKERIDPKEISFIDPCSGSGHILIYAFKVFYKIYEYAGYSKKDIPFNIIKYNINGLDIDDRAGQLSVLSLLLVAREYDSNIFSKITDDLINVTSLKESIKIDNTLYDNSLLKNCNIDYIMSKYIHAKDVGSLLYIDDYDYSNIIEILNNKNDIFHFMLKETLKDFIKQSNILKKKYNVVVTNPPYMGENMMNDILKDYLKSNFKDEIGDLCVAFIKRCYDFLKEDGICAMVTAQTWMFLSTYEQFRYYAINNLKFINCVHLGTGAFDSGFGTTSFVFEKKNSDEQITTFIRLVDYKTSEDKEYIIKEKKYNSDTYLYNVKDSLSIDGAPIAYWASEKIIENFKNQKQFQEYAVSKKGVISANDSKFVRSWFEVNFNDIGLDNSNYEEMIKNNPKWVVQTSGGFYRKWYGCLSDVILCHNDWADIKASGSKSIRFREKEYYFQEGITWSKFSSKSSLRYIKKGILFADNGPMIFPYDKTNVYYFLGLLNSKILQTYIDILNPSVATQIIDINRIPVLISNKDEIEQLVKKNIEISKDDWDSYETSWDFKTHPLITYKDKEHSNINNGDFKVKDAYELWQSICNDRFNLLKNNEEMLNQMFINIYGLTDEIVPEIDDKDITVRKADKIREIKSFISYSVGCMFGRYSLDSDGLILAGNSLDKEQYKTYMPDDDNIIPISENENIYYNDDIVGKFKEFLKCSFGENTLNENMDYIAEILGKKGTESSEDTIRRYFVNDFYSDHIKTYQKKPIYWLFDSGKKNGFKCLIYLHRYNEQIVSKIRTKYLHNTLSVYQRTLEEINYKLNSDELSTTDKRDLQNKKVDLNNKITECNEYEEMVGNVSNKMIKLDLDDGVIVNYSKFVDDNGKSILAKLK